MPDALSGKGALLKRGDGASPEVFTTVAGFTNFTLNRNRNIDSYKHHDDTGTGMQRLPLLKDLNITVEASLLPDAQSGIVSDWSNGTKRNFQFETPSDGSPSTKTYQFTAVVESFPESWPSDARATVSITLQIDGDITEV